MKGLIIRLCMLYRIARYLRESCIVFPETCSAGDARGGAVPFFAIVARELPAADGLTVGTPDITNKHLQR